MYFIQQPATPPALADAQVPTTVSVTSQEFSDPQDVTVSVAAGPAIALRVPRGGTVTQISCSPAEPWHSGASSISIDGAPVLNLHTSVPLWRDISVGTEGPDVAALKAELFRLGLTATEGDEFDRADLAAVRELSAKAGGLTSFTFVSPSQFVWLPAVDVTPRACAAVLSAQLDVSATVAEINPTVSLEIQAPPALRPGIRELTIDQVRIPLTEGLTPQDSADVAAILNAPSYRSASGEDRLDGRAVSIAGSIDLLEPVEAVALPPSSIAMTTESIGCVATADGATHRVTVVSSELGRTVVIFDETPPPDEIRVERPGRCA